MAMADYRWCDKCEGKAFYDANLNYGDSDDGPCYREAGKEQGYHSLHGLGDWAVLCPRCSQFNRTAVLPLEFTAELANIHYDVMTAMNASTGNVKSTLHRANESLIRLRKLFEAPM